MAVSVDDEQALVGKFLSVLENNMPYITVYGPFLASKQPMRRKVGAINCLCTYVHTWTCLFVYLILFLIHLKLFFNLFLFVCLSERVCLSRLVCLLVHLD